MNKSQLKIHIFLYTLYLNYAYQNKMIDKNNIKECMEEWKNDDLYKDEAWGGHYTTYELKHELKKYIICTNN
jgi:hypothetical protein